MPKASVESLEVGSALFISPSQSIIRRTRTKRGEKVRTGTQHGALLTFIGALLVLC